MGASMRMEGWLRTEFSAANCKRSHANPENTNEEALRRMAQLFEQEVEGARKPRKRRRRHKAEQNHGEEKTSRSSSWPQQVQRNGLRNEGEWEWTPYDPNCDLCQEQGHTKRNCTAQSSAAPGIDEELLRRLPEVANDIFQPQSPVLNLPASSGTQ